MHRIDHPTAKADANGAGKDGFTNGNAGVEAGTIPDADWANGLQESVCQAIEGSGIVLVKGTHTQLLSAMRAAARYTFGGATADSTTGLDMVPVSGLTIPGGYVLQGSDKELRVPAVGFYEVLFCADLRTTDATNPTQFGISIVWNGVAQQKITVKRPSADATASFTLSGVCFFEVTDQTEPIKFLSTSGQDVLIESTGFIAVRQIG